MKFLFFIIIAIIFIALFVNGIPIPEAIAEALPEPVPGLGSCISKCFGKKKQQACIDRCNTDLSRRTVRTNSNPGSVSGGGSPASSSMFGSPGENEPSQEIVVVAPTQLPMSRTSRRTGN